MEEVKRKEAMVGFDLATGEPLVLGDWMAQRQESLIAGGKTQMSFHLLGSTE